MPRLPNTENAVIDPEKLRDYILSSAHPVGRFKATFFQRMGYSSQTWEALEKGLRGLVLSQEVTRVEDSRFGQKFIIEGDLTGPAGITVRIVTVWVILRGESVPRFVTAYPGGPR